MALLSLLAIAGLATAQGQAVLLRYADEPGVTAVAVNWNGRAAPLVRRGDDWIGMVGVDLDTAAGERAVEVTFRYADGRTRTQSDAVAIAAVQYPTTELKVEERFVELSPEDQARAARDDEETGTDLRDGDSGNLLVRAVRLADTRDHLGAQLRSSARVQRAAAGATFGRGLARTTGTPIQAANRGRVVLAKDLFFSGNAIFIDHGLGVYSAYLHLSDIQVQVGDMIERGQVIGLAGATGRVTGPHLHWGARVLNARIDPFSLLKLEE